MIHLQSIAVRLLCDPSTGASLRRSEDVDRWTVQVQGQRGRAKLLRREGHPVVFPAEVEEQAVLEALPAQTHRAVAYGLATDGTVVLTREVSREEPERTSSGDGCDCCREMARGVAEVLREAAGLIRAHAETQGAVPELVRASAHTVVVEREEREPEHDHTDDRILALISAKLGIPLLPADGGQGK